MPVQVWRSYFIIMTTELLTKSVTPASRKLRLFSVYVDFPASVYARWAASEIRKLAAVGGIFSPGAIFNFDGFHFLLLREAGAGSAIGAGLPKACEHRTLTLL